MSAAGAGAAPAGSHVPRATVPALLWAAASSSDVVRLAQAELMLSQSLASKMRLCVTEHEIDGEVLQTFATCEEMSVAVGLPSVVDLSSHAIDSLPAAGESLIASASRWGQIIADAMAARRLFARVHAQTQATCSVDGLQSHLGRIIMAKLELRAPAQIRQFEALISVKRVVAAARLDGADLNLMAPSEAQCLLPPWMRGRDEVKMLLVSLMLRVRSNALVSSPMLELLPATIPASTIVVIGNTGAGKSTLLNAFLDEEELLPTNAMRACTASIIEMEFNLHQVQGAEYTAEIEFLTKEEWEREVKEAFVLVKNANVEETVGQGSRLKAPADNTPAHEAWCKLR